MPNGKGMIVREGFRVILPLAAITAALAAAGFSRTAGFFFLLTAFTLWFFRNPERVVPDEDKVVVSPADGRILKIEAIEEPSYLRAKCIKISIFMNIFDVHVNRIPYAGKIDQIVYKKGAFLSANLDKASEQNERNIVVLTTLEGKRIVFIQIAGIIARRIVSWIKPGQDLRRGERFGLICFGSRLELFLPADSRIVVKPGDRVTAGSTKMGYLS